MHGESDCCHTGYSSCKLPEALTTGTSHMVEWDEVTMHQREEGKLLYVYKCSVVEDGVPDHGEKEEEEAIVQGCVVVAFLIWIASTVRRFDV